MNMQRSESMKICRMCKKYISKNINNMYIIYNIKYIHTFLHTCHTISYPT